VCGDVAEGMAGTWETARQGTNTRHWPPRSLRQMLSVILHCKKKHASISLPEVVCHPCESYLYSASSAGGPCHRKLAITVLVFNNKLKSGRYAAEWSAAVSFLSCFRISPFLAQE
jgi:hypothetical protein